MTDAHALAGQIRKDLWSIRDFYEEALNPPRLTSGIKLPTQPVPDDRIKYAAKVVPHSPPPVDLAVIEARQKAHHDLLHYTRIIQFEVTDINGGTIQTRVDGGDIASLAVFIDTWAVHLVEQTSEGEMAAADFAKHAKTLRRMARPDRRDWMPIGECPVTVADAEGNPVPCGEQVRAYDRTVDEGYTVGEFGTERKLKRIQFIRCPGCGTEDTLAWWMSQIVPEGSDLAHADAVIACVVSRTFQPLTHEQLRQWAARGFVMRHGKDTKGRTLYSSKAVLAYAQHQIKEEAA
jgi:hypothetical protein